MERKLLMGFALSLRPTHAGVGEHGAPVQGAGPCGRSGDGESDTLPGSRAFAVALGSSVMEHASGSRACSVTDDGCPASRSYFARCGAPVSC